MAHGPGGAGSATAVIVGKRTRRCAAAVRVKVASGIVQVPRTYTLPASTTTQVIYGTVVPSRRGAMSVAVGTHITRLGVRLWVVVLLLWLLLRLLPPVRRHSSAVARGHSTRMHARTRTNDNHGVELGLHEGRGHGGCDLWHGKQTSSADQCRHARDCVVGCGGGARGGLCRARSAYSRVVETVLGSTSGTMSPVSAPAAVLQVSERGAGSQTHTRAEFGCRRDFFGQQNNSIRASRLHCGYHTLQQRIHQFITIENMRPRLRKQQDKSVGF